MDSSIASAYRFSFKSVCLVNGLCSVITRLLSGGNSAYPLHIIDRLLIGGNAGVVIFPHVFVASSGGEYFQVSFNDKAGSDDTYFLIQRQFEDDDGGSFYVESHERTFCGRSRIRKAELGKDWLRLQITSRPPKLAQITFRADRNAYSRLKRVLRIMMPAGAQHLVIWRLT